MPRHAQRRPWFWQLQGERRGPDWLCLASFAPADAPALAAAVRRHAPAGFVAIPSGASPCGRHRQAHSHDLYADPNSAPGLTANLAGERAGNVWVYHSIERCGSDLTLERGYGGYPGGPADEEETALLVALAREPGLTLAEWRIVAGGEGYPVETVARGADGASLLAYLASPDDSATGPAA